MQILLIILLAIIGVLTLTGLFFYHSHIVTFFYDLKRWISTTGYKIIDFFQRTFTNFNKWVNRNWKKIIGITVGGMILGGGVLIPRDNELPSADVWLGIGSAELDDSCDSSSQSLKDALDGTDDWLCGINEVHWFVIDLGQSYLIKKVRGRSNSARDPIDINIYIDDNNPPTTLIEETITTWQDTANWVEIDISDSEGRYIKVEIEDTEDGCNRIQFGDQYAPFTIFDAYGDITALPNNAPTFSGEIPADDSDHIGLSPTMNITIGDADGDSTTVDWYYNATIDSGSWTHIDHDTTHPANTSNATTATSGINQYNHKYNIKVTANDGTDNSSTVWSFTTEDTPHTFTVVPTPSDGGNVASIPKGGVFTNASINFSDGSAFFDVFIYWQNGAAWEHGYSAHTQQNSTHSIQNPDFAVALSWYNWSVNLTKVTQDKKIIEGGGDESYFTQMGLLGHSSIYDNHTGCLFIAWSEENGSSQDTFVTKYNPETFETTTISFDDDLSGDYHRCPVIFINESHYLHGFSCQGSIITHKSVSVDTFSSFSNETNISGTWTIPYIAQDPNDYDKIMMVIREGDGNDRDGHFTTSSDGGETWSATTEFFDATLAANTDWSYQSLYSYRHDFKTYWQIFQWIRDRETEDNYRNVSYLWSDDFGITWHNLNGNTLSLPVDDLDEIRIWEGMSHEVSSEQTNHFGIKADHDESNNTYITWHWGNASEGIWNGFGKISDTSFTNATINNGYKPSEARWGMYISEPMWVSGNIIDVYLVNDDGTDTDELQRWRTTDGGTNWAKFVNITSGTTNQVFFPNVIYGRGNSFYNITFYDAPTTGTSNFYILSSTDTILGEQLGDWTNNTYDFATTTVYNTSVRTNGVDYFVWLGENTSAWHIKQILTSLGFDEGVEYIAVWRNQ